MSDDIIGMAKRLLGGVLVIPETLAVDVIEQVGPGGHYLTQEHTRTHFRAETWFPTLIDRQMRRTWAATGAQALDPCIRARVLDLLENHQPLPLPAGAEARLDDIIAGAKARHQG